MLGGRTILRVSSRQLIVPRGGLIGSIKILLEDITTQRALTEERRKSERGEVINQIVARFARG